MAINFTQGIEYLLLRVTRRHVLEGTLRWEPSDDLGSNHGFGRMVKYNSIPCYLDEGGELYQTLRIPDTE